MTIKEIINIVAETSKPAETYEYNRGHFNAIVELRCLLNEHPEAVGDATQYRQHAGDCSIFGAASEICDCGAFRHNINLLAVPTAQDNVTWFAHLDAIERSKKGGAK